MSLGGADLFAEVLLIVATHGEGSYSLCVIAGPLAHSLGDYDALSWEEECR